MTPEESPRTPLTLEFVPDNIEYDDDGTTAIKGIVVLEPSFQGAGRIFVGINPVGKRLGVHLLPEEALRVRNHLTKLLMEPSDADPVPPPRDPTHAQGPEPIQERINRAVERLKGEQGKRKWLQFRLEFRAGEKLQGVIERRNG